MTSLDPSDFVVSRSIAGYFEWKISPELPAMLAGRGILHAISKLSFDLTFVDSGSLISLELLKKLKEVSRWVVNFNHDDPFSSRDGTRFNVYRRALAAYDLVVVVRQPNVSEAYAHGAQDVMLTIRTSDIVAHSPKIMSNELKVKWRSRVLFAGTWMESRGRFMLELLRSGVPLTIFGSRWDRAPEWAALRKAWAGDELVGDDYAYAIQSAQICIGMLSSGNRDLHTTRSLEIPRLGSVFCAPRTTEHLDMYLEGKQAVFWSDSAECAKLCNALLSNEVYRKAVAKAGQERCVNDNHTNDNLIVKILARLLSR